MPTRFMTHFSGELPALLKKCRALHYHLELANGSNKIIIPYTTFYPTEILHLQVI